MFMILFVLDNPDQLDRLLDAWAKIGINGATIIESTGIHRRLRAEAIPMRYFFQAPIKQELTHFTLVAIVPDELTIQACLEATENLVGDLDLPNTGVFAAWPLHTSKGITSSSKAQD